MTQNKTIKSIFLLLLVIGVSSVFLPSAAIAQRDYFTAEEVELIRDAQEIDQRIDVLTHAIDRRFAVLKIEVGGPRIPQKESEKWGAAPQGTRLDLLLDIKHILQKAIDDIDTLYERPNSAILPDPTEKKDAKGFKDLFPKAVHHLADAAQRYVPALKTELDNSKDNVEKGSILSSLEFCEQIIEAAPKAKIEEPKKAGKVH